MTARSCIFTMEAFYILSWLALCVRLVICADPELESEWYEWRRRFRNSSRTKRSGQQHRRDIWEDNYRFIEDHNKRYIDGKETFNMAMNQFGDLTVSEFSKKAKIILNAKREGLMLSATKLRQAASKLNITAIDYWTEGYVTPVQDQGFCGSCWAYSATGALEAQWFKKTGKLIPLSKQQLVDCSTPTGNKACVGGRPSLAYMYIMQNGGIQTEASYPYVMKEQPCAFSRSQVAVTVKDWKYVPVGDEQALEDTLVTIGPVAVVIDSTQRSFQFYRSGIYYEPKCSIWKQAHAMLLTGFGSQESEPFWIIKNSMGPWWGENGYLRLAKNRDCHCGIGQYGVVPFV